ncbi:MAG: DNA-binding protein [Actinobacteria bacterium]|nr:DNA-binding protein [Actinomycetota bacterium]
MSKSIADKAELEGIVHAEGTGGRVIVFRVKPGFDIIEGIKKVCKYYDIKAGTFLSSSSIT